MSTLQYFEAKSILVCNGLVNVSPICYYAAPPRVHLGVYGAVPALLQLCGSVQFKFNHAVDL